MTSKSRLTKSKLWTTQKREWPNSIKITPYQLLQFINDAHTANAKFRRAMSVACTTQHNCVLYYLTDPNGGHIGARFGLNGADYQSGFSDNLVQIQGDRLVELE